MSRLIESGEIKQIIVVGGSSSNTGVSPAEAAGRAFAAGITVSAVGVIDNIGGSDGKDLEELKEITKAGGGYWQYSTIEELCSAIRLIAEKTARGTIERMVERQLKTVIGEDIRNLGAGSRRKIVDFIEKYGKNVNIKCIIVLDTGGNMGDNLHIVKKSVAALLESLQHRNGSVSIAVITYPADNSNMCSVACGFTSEASILEEKLERAAAGSGTPTGPAIMKACMLMHDYYGTIEELEEDNISSMHKDPSLKTNPY